MKKRRGCNKENASNPLQFLEMRNFFSKRWLFDRGGELRKIFIRRKYQRKRRFEQRRGLPLFFSNLFRALGLFVAVQGGASHARIRVQQEEKRRRIKFFVVSRFFSLSLRSLSNFDNREFMIRGMNDRGGGKFRCSFVRQVISRDVGQILNAFWIADAEGGMGNFE